MTSLPTQRPEQTPAQWAVRWHGIVLVAALLLPVPLVHLVWHAAFGHDAPLLRTRSQVPAPVATWDAVLHESPSWMQRKERQLREDSPVTWWLRGTWNEVRYRLGVPQSGAVHFGADEWFFTKGAVDPDVAALDAARPARVRFLGEVRDLVRAAGAELFVDVLPDKERVYPDKCYRGGVMPAAKAGVYGALLADLAAAGIPTVDLAGAMRDARAVQPDVELYFRRDTHWRPQGALVAGRAMAAAIDQRFGGVLGPKVPMGLAGLTAIDLVGDLPANMGILTVELPNPVTTWRTTPLSLLAHRLAEVREYYGVELRPPGAAAVAMDGNDANAPVLMLGASFAEENGMNALALFLQRPVRGLHEKGTSGMGSLQRALPELRAGTKAKVVVWELAERGFFDAAWRDPRL